MRRSPKKLKPLPVKYEPPYALPRFAFAPSTTNLFKVHKTQRSLFPHCYRNSDSIQGYVGYLGARNKVTHATFPRFPPRKLYANIGDTLLPPRRSLPKLNTRRTSKRCKKKTTFCNPFAMHNPSAETIFLVGHEKHGQRPLLRHASP